MDTPFLLIVLTLTFTMSWSMPEAGCFGNGPCKRYFKYMIKNQLQPPYFEASVWLRVFPQETMIRYMEQAVLEKPQEFVNFRAQFTSPYGYFIETIHDLTSTYLVNKTYWQISNASGPLNLGVSSYIPSPGDIVIFNFIQE